MRVKKRTGTQQADKSLIIAEESLSLPVSEVLERLRTSNSGLSQEEAALRQETYGYNEVAERARSPLTIRFLSHFKSPITIILIIAAILSGILGDISNTIIIFAIVLISVILDFTQEFRAEKAADELRKRVANTVTVYRGGNKQDMAVSELVPGDIIGLSVGDIVPADARVMNARDFFVDQSALTGESFPSEKTAETIPETSVSEITRWNNFLFMGTSVTNGTAMAAVVSTGSATQYGEIVKKSTAKKPETEFEKGLKRFGFLIMQVTFVLVVLVFLVNTALLKRSTLDSVLFAVALSVGLTPGLLPMILSINLARGAVEMSKKGVIVKRLSSIQNFGSMDILCADKTGTLTENRVTVIRHVDFEGADTDKVFTYSLLNSRFQTGLKNALDEAILKYKDVNTDNYKRIDEIPFDFVRRRLSIIVRENNRNILITKGAPEEFYGLTTRYELKDNVYDLTSEIKSKIEYQYNDLSSKGFRVLSVCYRESADNQQVFAVADEKDMTFLGFIAFVDPLKETAGESVDLLRQAGVKLKILTGDNEVVASNIGQQLGFQIYQSRRGKRFDVELGHYVHTYKTDSMNVLRGSDIAVMDDDVLAKAVEKADIFARVNPGQKNRIMNALRANGHVVGYIGDGINDTPSMKVADVSISVANAVDIAKESAEIILLKNDLKVIRDGIIVGRKTFGNTMKYILMAISSNFGNMFSAAIASFFLPFLPMLPIQILLNNLLYSFAQLSLPTDNVDDQYILKPQRLQTSFIRNFMIAFGPVSSLFDFLTFFILFAVFKASSPNFPSLFQTAWFVESLFTQTLVIFAIRTRHVPFFRSKSSRQLFWNIMIVLAITLIIPFTIAGNFFQFVPLPAKFLLILVGFIAVYLFLVELMKAWFYRRFAPD